MVYCCRVFFRWIISSSWRTWQPHELVNKIAGSWHKKPITKKRWNPFFASNTSKQMFLCALTMLFLSFPVRLFLSELGSNNNWRVVYLGSPDQNIIEYAFSHMNWGTFNRTKKGMSIAVRKRSVTFTIVLQRFNDAKNFLDQSLKCLDHIEVARISSLVWYFR